MTHFVFLTALLFSAPALNKKKAPFIILTFGVLFLFLAIRYGYGNDYFSYFNIHSTFNEGGTAWGENDILFKYLNLLIPNYFIYIAIISFFYLFAIFFLIKHNLSLKQCWLAVLLLLVNPYLFLVHLSSIRQTIAICFVIFAVHYAVKRKIIPYLIFIMIAAGFHGSAIILLPIYFFLTETKINKKKFIGIFLALALLFFTPLFDYILNMVLNYFPQYYHYANQGLQNSLRSTLITLFFFFLFVLNINKLEGREIVYGKLALLSITISLLTFKLTMLGRVGMYLDVFLIIAFPLIFSKIKNKTYRRILLVMVLMIYLMRYMSFFTDPVWAPFYSDYKTILGVSM